MRRRNDDALAARKFSQNEPVKPSNVFLSHFHSRMQVLSEILLRLLQVQMYEQEFSK